MARDKMVDLLIKKGVISEEELAAYEAEATGTTAMQTASNSILMGGYVQPRWEWTDAEVGDAYNSFRIRRAYWYIVGSVFPDWDVFFSYEFVPGVVIDANITYKYAPWLQVTAGQFLLPFSLEQLTSGSKLLTIERAMVSNALADHRDIGIRFAGTLMEEKVGYGAAVVNGNGINTTDENEKKDIVARVVARPWCTGEGPLCGLTAAGGIQIGEQTVWGVDELGADVDLGDEKRTRYIGTIQWVYGGIDVQGEYLYEKWDDTDVESDGFYIQGGYGWPVNGMIVEPVVKYESYDPDDAVSDDETSVITIGANLHFNGVKHLTKLQANYRIIDEEPVDTDNNEFIVQWQHRW
jgi:hypothetical protein